MPGDDAVPRVLLLLHPEVATAVGLQLVELLEAARVEQPIEPLARGELALRVLPLHAPLTASFEGLLLEGFESLEVVVLHGARC